MHTPQRNDSAAPMVFYSSDFLSTSTAYHLSNGGLYRKKLQKIFNELELVLVTGNSDVEV